jgi:tight adherence protein B
VIGMNEKLPLAIGLVIVLAASAAAYAALVGWRSNRLPLERRTRPGQAPAEGTLANPTRRMVGLLEKGLAGTGRTRQLAAALDLAGLHLRAGDFLLLVAAATLAGAALGLVLLGPAAAVAGAAIAPIAAVITVKVRTGRRRSAFADQLEDSLQLLTGGLRAGHSLLRALDAAAHESESPTSEEFRRVINETRVGRPLNDSLNDTAARMVSKDFTWVVQAIAIHREVGGDLAEVLDTIGHTIRERNQIRRQVKALSAEGRLSGYVLVLLPFVVAGALTLINPGYLHKLTTNPIGWGMLAAAALLITAGALWLRKVVSFKF